MSKSRRKRSRKMGYEEEVKDKIKENGRRKGGKENLYQRGKNKEERYNGREEMEGKQGRG